LMQKLDLLTIMGSGRIKGRSSKALIEDQNESDQVANWELTGCSISIAKVYGVERVPQELEHSDRAVNGVTFKIREELRDGTRNLICEGGEMREGWQVKSCEFFGKSFARQRGYDRRNGGRHSITKILSIFPNGRVGWKISSLNSKRPRRDLK
jgi:hypothetical protein